MELDNRRAWYLAKAVGSGAAIWYSSSFLKNKIASAKKDSERADNVMGNMSGSLKKIVLSDSGPTEKDISDLEANLGVLRSLSSVDAVESGYNDLKLVKDNYAGNDVGAAKEAVFTMREHLMVNGGQIRNDLEKKEGYFMGGALLLNCTLLCFLAFNVYRMLVKKLPSKVYAPPETA